MMKPIHSFASESKQRKDASTIVNNNALGRVGVVFVRFALSSFVESRVVRTTILSSRINLALLLCLSSGKSV